MIRGKEEDEGEEQHLELPSGLAAEPLLADGIRAAASEAEAREVGGRRAGEEKEGRVGGGALVFVIPVGLPIMDGSISASSSTAAAGEVSLRISSSPNLLDPSAASSAACCSEHEGGAWEEAPVTLHYVQCWGCGLQLSLPYHSLSFKCGHCGALTWHPTHEEQVMRGRRKQPCGKCVYLRDRVVVAVTSLLLIAIIAGGVWASFPLVCPNLDLWFALHACITTLLAFNTVFNYAMCVLSKAGPVPAVAFGKVDLVEADSLLDFSLCWLCRKPKPPSAHHCRQCGECVMDMDHHCPFIGNCVGAYNQRFFILFLLYAIVSCIYIIFMSSSAILRLWPSVVEGDALSQVDNYAFFSVAAFLKAITRSLWSMKFVLSTRLVVLGYLAMISVSCVVAIGLLLYSQVQFILEGQSMIDSLKSKPPSMHFPNQPFGLISSSVGKGTVLQSFRRVFGKGHPCTWFLPHVLPAKGSQADFLQQKLHYM